MIIATIICEVVLIKFPAQLTARDEKLLAQSVIWLDRLLVYSSICGLKSAEIYLVTTSSMNLSACFR